MAGDSETRSVAPATSSSVALIRRVAYLVGSPLEISSAPRSYLSFVGARMRQGRISAGSQASLKNKSPRTPNALYVGFPEAPPVAGR